MTKITASELEHLAQLSGLSLKPEEINNLSKDLSEILNYVELLSSVDTEGVEPTYQVTGLKNVWREDEVKNGVEPNALLGLLNESEVTARQIKIPKVL